MVRWVDCYIDKFLAVHPRVQPFVAMIDRWSFVPRLAEGELSFDEREIKRAESVTMDLYGIERRLGDGWFDERLDSGIPVLIPCDLYYLPYAGSHYQKLHMFHYLLVKYRISDHEYMVYDDNPAHEGAFPRQILEEAYRSVEEPYEWYPLRDEAKSPGMQDELKHLVQHLRPGSIHLGAFLQGELLQPGLQARERLHVLQGLTVPVKRLHGLSRIVECLRAVWPAQDLIEMETSFKTYVDTWSITTHLAAKGLYGNPEDAWSRIERRIEKLLELEEQAKQEISRLVQWVASANSV